MKNYEITVRVPESTAMLLKYFADMYGVSVQEFVRIWAAAEGAGLITTRTNRREN